MNEDKKVIKAIIVTCKEDGCKGKFVLDSTKVRRQSQTLCKRHRNVKYKKKHTQLRNELMDQYQISQKVFDGTECEMSGEPISTILNQVLQQKRLDLLKSPEVVKFLKMKQNEVLIRKQKERTAEKSLDKTADEQKYSNIHKHRRNDFVQSTDIQGKLIVKTEDTLSINNSEPLTFNQPSYVSYSDIDKTGPFHSKHVHQQNPCMPWLVNGAMFQLPSAYMPNV